MLFKGACDIGVARVLCAIAKKKKNKFDSHATLQRYEMKFYLYFSDVQLLSIPIRYSIFFALIYVSKSTISAGLNLPRM